MRPEAGLLRLRKDLALFANLRPAICYPALAASSSLKPEVVEGPDLLIVRELTGGVYFGEPKEIVDLGNGQKRGIDTQVYDTFEIERIAGVAFELARTRRNHVTSMEKRNVMKSGVLWHEVVTDTDRARYADVKLDHMLADAGGMQLVRWPKQFDVIVTDNLLFGDMLSDVAAMLTGSLGMLPSASLGAPDKRTGARKALYEPVHGSAPDIAGTGSGQPDRHDRLIRHVPSLFLRHERGGRQAGGCDRRRSRRRVEDPGHHVGRKGRRSARGHGRCRSREVPRLSWLAERRRDARRSDGAAILVRRFCRLCPAEQPERRQGDGDCGDSADQGQLVAEGQQRSRHADRADERDEDGARQRSVLFIR